MEIIFGILIGIDLVLIVAAAVMGVDSDGTGGC